MQQRGVAERCDTALKQKGQTVEEREAKQTDKIREPVTEGLEINENVVKTLDLHG